MTRGNQREIARQKNQKKQQNAKKKETASSSSSSNAKNLDDRRNRDAEAMRLKQKAADAKKQMDGAAASSKWECLQRFDVNVKLPTYNVHDIYY